MGRLIDADALLSEMGKYSDLSARYKDEYLSGMQQRLETCIELVEDAPTVDAVPVVRCKDCLHNRACEIQYHAQAGDLFFCGAAERKDGEHDRG